MITLEQAIQERHSVRSYKNTPISAEAKKDLEALIAQCNKDGGLHIQLVVNEPQAFDSFMAHYGKFSGVSNYIAMIGPKSADLEEKCGYYGEKLVLRAQQLGLNTCWVAMTYKKIKTAFEVKEGEKLCVVIAIGYGATQGMQHKSKAAQEVTQVSGDMPEWFKKGVDAALLAPTAMNQQKFVFSLKGEEAAVKAGMGFYSKIDLGIVRYHFEAASKHVCKCIG